jgi:aspartyl-tRNA(Asn)/glutamyl-tRNA(Gln) amidotransferase subunit A
MKNDRDWTITRLAPRIRKREISPVELTRSVLEAIESLQPRLNAFITVTADLALDQARRAEKEIVRGNYRGPLHGIPITLKDLFYTRGIRTTAGSRILGKFVPDEDAVVVTRLYEAGAVLVGKTNLHEFAFGATNVNPHFGPAKNPWDLSRVSGGSSGGSAVAVAAGLGLASLGSDTGGSIRIPAAACGIVGLKPTLGKVPLEGVIPLASTLDHVGPMCRSVEDAALVLEVIEDPSTTGKPRGRRRRFPLRAGLRGLKIGVARGYFFDRLQPDVRKAVIAAISVLEKEGAEIREVTLRGLECTAELASTLTVAEALPFHWKWLNERSRDYGDDLRVRMTAQKALTAVTYLLSQERRRAYRREFDRAMEGIDALAAPTLPVIAPKIEEVHAALGKPSEEVRSVLLRLTRPSNLTGFPAISVPCGFSREGMPIGLQLIGREEGEGALLRASYGFERATEWHTRFPSL